MQVTNSTYTNYYNQTNNTTKAEKTEESSFSLILTSSQKEDVDEQGRLLKYMDKYNAFDFLSQEDRKIFREIDDASYRRTILGQVQMNIAQVHFTG